MRTKTQVMRLIQMVILAGGLLGSCKKDKDPVKLPPPVLNSPEVITSMVLQFTDSANSATKSTIEFRDPDGAGGNAPTRFDTIRLVNNRVYLVNIILLDETKMPFDTISKEVWKERNHHQFFFSHSGVNVNTFYLDKDDNNHPVGISTKWKTGTPGNGSSHIVLKHQQNTKNGTSGPGETDVEVSFKTIIQ